MSGRPFRCWHRQANRFGCLAGYGETVGLDGVYLVPALAGVPDFDQRVLHDVFGFRVVERDTESKPVKFVLQRQDIISETDRFHLLSDIMTIGGGESYRRGRVFCLF